MLLLPIFMLTPVNNHARWLNKKGRQRQNVKLRREIQRQHEGADTIWFGAEGDGVGGADDAMVMNRLIKEQVGDKGMDNLDDNN